MSTQPLSFHKVFSQKHPAPADGAGDRLRRARKAIPMSQRQIAECSCRSKSQISYVEGGHHVLTLSTASMICSSTRIRAEWLWLGEEPMLHPEEFVDARDGKPAAPPAPAEEDCGGRTDGDLIERIVSDIEAQRGFIERAVRIGLDPIDVITAIVRNL